MMITIMIFLEEHSLIGCAPYSMDCILCRCFCWYTLVHIGCLLHIITYFVWINRVDIWYFCKLPYCLSKLGP